MIDLEKEATPKTMTECTKNLLPIRDALHVLSGKWKLTIIVALFFGSKRFKEMEREIVGITAKMLSQELKELEANQLVKRTVFNTTPVTVEYELTEYGWSLEKVINALRDWGKIHRERMIV